MRRPLALLLVLAASLALAACGKENETTKVGETEATYLTLGGLKYQVQISRQLNPFDTEDRAYVQGVDDTTPLGQDAWFGVFMRVQNPTDRALFATSDFEIHDTQGNVYRPLPLPATNEFRYEAQEVQPDNMLPAPGSPAFNGPIRGSLLLFRLKRESFENRPLELIIRQSGVSGEATVALDV